ncbi:MAG TPA: 30S ribosomal protein S20 [Spirochaetota bacterium]|nr:30S ribosomal protein S20 [Spirochaetota bacterium]
MANIRSAQQRIKTNEKAKSSNRQVKSAMRSTVKKVVTAMNPQDENHANLAEIHKSFIKTIDSAARKGIVKKKTAARKKSRIAKKVNALAKQSQAPKA